MIRGVIFLQPGKFNLSPSQLLNSHLLPHSKDRNIVAHSSLSVTNMPPSPVVICLLGKKANTQHPLMYRLYDLCTLHPGPLPNPQSRLTRNGLPLPVRHQILLADQRHPPRGPLIILQAVPVTRAGVWEAIFGQPYHPRINLHLPVQPGQDQCSLSWGQYPQRRGLHAQIKCNLRRR